MDGRMLQAFTFMLPDGSTTDVSTRSLVKVEC